MSTDRIIRRAVPSVVEALAEHGVVDVKWFLAYDGEPVIWLATATDAQKAGVAAAGCHGEAVRRLLAEAGLVAHLAAAALVTVESQEAVDRDFEGSWFLAMK